MISPRHIRRSGRRATPGAAPGVSAQAAMMVRQAWEAMDSCENKMFAEMYATALDRKVYHNDNHLFEFMKHLEHPPVDIEEFLDSPEFLGATDISIWPEVRKAIVEINRNWWKGPKHAIHEAVLCGSTSSGKSELAKITTLYHLYLLSCVDVPQALYGLPKTTSIVFVILAAKPHVTKKVLYAPMRLLVETIPYFQKHLRPDRLVESEMIFSEKNIRVVPGGADAETVLGEAIIGGIIDEINFMNVVLKSKRAEVSTGRAGIYDQAQTIHNTVTRRKKGRFISQGPLLGVVCTSSSTRYKGDFTDKRKALVHKNNEKGVYIYDKPQYEVWPQERYCGDKFRMMVGNDVVGDTRILAPWENAKEGTLVLDIPVEYLADFQADPYSALRDICGISTSSINPFLRRRFKAYEAIDAGQEEGLASFLEKDNVILGVDDMPMVQAGHYCTNPSRPRYVHIDLSTTGDRCVAGGQPVLMADGRYVPIEQVRIGDLVVTHEGAHEEVTQVFDNGVKRTLSVHTYGWPAPLRATATHKVWAVRRASVSYADGRLVKPSDPMFFGKQAKAAKEGYAYTPEFVELGTLVPGDFLVTPRKRSQEASNICGIPLTYETGYIAGLFAAEGSFYEHSGSEYVQFSLHENEVRILRELGAYLQEYFGVTTRVCRDKKSKGITVRVGKSDTLVSFLLTAVGEYSHRKHLDCAHLGNGLFHAGIAHGYVDGDGYVQYTSSGEAKGFKVKTVSRQMAHSFYWLLVSNGYLPSLGETDEYIGKDGTSHRKCYHVSLMGEESMRLFASWLAVSVDVPCSRALALKDYVLTPIVEIVDGGRSRVYDITVGETHSYVVGNVAVHNCGIAMVRYDGMTDVTRTNNVIERLPVVSVELACSIEPDANNEIQFAEVRTWVKQLRDVYGYPIKAVTYDGVFSIESIQQWKKQGMKTGHMSVDRTSTPYKQFRDGLYDGRIRMFEQPKLIEELFELEYDDVKDKVDHPVNGSKDIADAVCGAYATLLLRRSSWSSAQMEDGAVSDGRAQFEDRSEYGGRL